MARKTLWEKYLVGSTPRWRLYAQTDSGTYVERAYFIARCRYSPGRSVGRPYSLHASGMDPSGCAADRGWFKTLAEAKAQAVKLADVDGTPVDRVVVGNATFLIGDRVTPSGDDIGIRGRRRFGVILSLTSGGSCTVQWDDHSLPSEYRVSFLMLESEKLAQFEEARRRRREASLVTAEG